LGERIRGGATMDLAIRMDGTLVGRQDQD